MSHALLRQYDEIDLMADGYPRNWHYASTYTQFPTGQRFTFPAIKHHIRELAEYRCVRCSHPYRTGDMRISEGGEWSPCDEHCSHGGPFRSMAPDNVPSMVHLSKGLDALQEGYRLDAQWRILTVHHLDEDKANCRWWNLAALCQRCHLRMQRAVVMGRPYHYEHSDWFKPYAAGFYAWKYLGEDLEREETMSRLPQLLALEHRFTQEVLL